MNLSIMNAVKMAANTGVNSGGMRADGRADTNETRQKAEIHAITSGDKINKEVADKGFKLIQNSVKEAANWTAQLFQLIRDCEDTSVAWASFTYSEEQAIKWFRETIQQSDPDYSGKIRNLADVARYNGDKQLSYSVTKSKLKGIIDDETALCDGLQKWYNFQQKHDGFGARALPEGFLNIYSKRYDGKKGSTVFMRDAREAREGANMLENRTAQMRREGAKADAAKTGEQGEQAVSGATAGVRQNTNLPAVIFEAQNNLLRAIQDCYEEIGNDEWVANKLQALAVEMRELVAIARKEVKDKVAATSSKPSQAIADAARQERAELAAADVQNGEADDTEEVSAAAQDEELPEPELTEEDEAHINSMGDDKQQVAG
jgi:hypothetical protein